MKEKDIKCSFCGKSKDDNGVNLLISGISAHICNNCIEQAGEIVKEDFKHKQSENDSSVLTLLKPKEIVEHLGQYIIGQDDAKKVLAVAVYNHYKRLNQTIEDDEVEIEKSNLILVGETGTGKTLVGQNNCQIIECPFAIADATVLTEAGYVGEDVESILSKLLQASDYDVASAERGIIFIDEIDKIARKSDNPSITRDVSGEGVQQALLKLLEGSIVNVPPQGGRKHPDQKMVKIDTQNILFICGGAFDGIKQIIERRVKIQAIGFSNDDSVEFNEDNILSYVNQLDIKQYGLIPELIGRFPVLTHLDPLDKGTLLLILKEPKNSLMKQYAKLFALDGIALTIEDDVLDFIVDKAIDLKLGARGLRSICEAILTDAMFDAPSNDITELTIDLTYAKGKFSKSKISQIQEMLG